MGKYAIWMMCYARVSIFTVILGLLLTPGCVNVEEKDSHKNSVNVEKKDSHKNEIVKLIETHWAARRLYDDTYYRYHSPEDQKLYNESLSDASDNRIINPMTSDQVNAICDLAIKDSKSNFNRTEVEWSFDTISISQRKLRKMVHTLPLDYLETEKFSPAYYWYIHYRMQALALDTGRNFDPHNEKFESLVRNFGDFQYKSEVKHLAEQDLKSNKWFEGDRTYW